MRPCAEQFVNSPSRLREAIWCTRRRRAPIVSRAVAEVGARCAVRTLVCLMCVQYQQTKNKRRPIRSGAQVVQHLLARSRRQDACC